MTLRSLSFAAIFVLAGMLVSVESVSAATLVVNKTTNCTAGDFYYLTIQSAVNDANAGDLIYVCPDTYTENVDVNVSVEIRSYSQSPSDTIVSASVTSDHVFYVTADGVNISGFTVTGAGSGYAGVYLYNSNYSKIENINASNNDYGIRLSTSSSNYVTSNNITSSSRGIQLSSSDDNNITSNNIITFGADGFYVYQSDNNNITSNTITTSGYSTKGISLDRSSNNNILSNTMDTVSWAIYIQYLRMKILLSLYLLFYSHLLGL
jgi:parallel beta-helix repeat protein